MIPRTGRYGPVERLAIPEEILVEILVKSCSNNDPDRINLFEGNTQHWLEKMREKSSKMTDFACLGRSTDRYERNLMEIAGFY